MTSAAGSAESKASALLAIAVAGSALAIGTVHTVTLCAVAAVLAISTVMAWWNAEPIRVRPAATLLLFTGVGLTAYTALQCVPMPIGWLAAIAPQNADVWSHALEPLDEPGPRWAPISLDPTATRVEVLKGLAYLFAFLTALRIARRRQGVTALSAVVVLTGVVLGVAAVLHPALGAHKLYGLYQPGYEIQYRHIAPLLNPNHLAAYINLSFCISLAATLSNASPVPWPITGALALILFGFQVWVASRGGVVAIVVGAVAVVVSAWASRTERNDLRKWLALACGGAVFAGVGALVLGTVSEAGHELSDTSLSKFKVLLDMPRMLAAYGILGAGRGTFESTYPRFRNGDWNLTVTNPENLLAQWATEWGVFVTVAALVCVIIALRPTEALARSRMAAGAWGGLLAVAVQNMADYNSEIPGVMVSVAVCAAIIVARSGGRTPSRVGHWPFGGRTVAGVAAIAGLLGLGGAISALHRELGDDQKRMHDAAFAQPSEVGRIADLARAAMLRHPSEPYLPYIVGVIAAHARDGRAVRWLNAALERGRTYGSAHYILARILALRSPSQARFEYRLAYEQAGELQSIVEREAPSLVRQYSDAMELVSDDGRGLVMLDALAVALAERLPATSERLDAQLIARKPGSVTVLRRKALASITDVENAESWCVGSERPGCVGRALVQAKSVQVLEPMQCEGYVLAARILVSDGQSSQALELLQHGADMTTDRDDCLRALAAAAAAAHDDSRLESAIGQIEMCVDRECVTDVIWAAQAEERRGQLGRALAAYKRAQELAPDDDAVLANVARLDESAGLDADALTVVQTLARFHPTEERWKNDIQRLRKVMLKP